VALDRRSGEKPEERDVFVASVGGGPEIPAVVRAGYDAAVGWTPDGAHLLFASDRGGSKGLWAVPWSAGAPRGEPILIKSDINLDEPLGVTRSGALYYGVTLSSRDVYLAEVDAGTGAVLSPPFRPIEQFVGGNSAPDWSPDGSSLAYVSRGTVLAIRAMRTGETRELRPGLDPLFTPRWAPDGRSLAAIGRDGQGRYGIHRIDPGTGSASLVVEAANDLGIWGLDWLPDSKKIVFRERQKEGFAVVEYDIDAGTRRELARGGILSLSLSPDGRHLAYVTDAFQLMLLPMSGGEPRAVQIQGGQKGPVMVFSWTPDSRAMLVGIASPAGDSRALWLVAPDGSQPRKLDLNLELTVVPLRFNPRTNQIAITSNVTRRELWVMENFLPALKAASPAR
jgi:Tol biopolymer transport system component